MPVFVNNLQEKTKITSKLLDTMESVVKTALRLEGRADDPEVSIALVDDNYIRDLNFRYRSIDRATDVLSFPMDETMEDGENILGDIVISTETADRQAGEYNHPFLREMAYLAAHGMFHLLGYDHNDEKNRRVMREKEEKVLSVLDISR